MVNNMILYNQKGGKQMSKKKKKKIKKSLNIIVQLLIAIGTLLTGIATMIQALR